MTDITQKKLYLLLPSKVALMAGMLSEDLGTGDRLYCFDSTRVFPEDSLDAAKRFGIENGQIAIFIISEGKEIRLQ